MSWVEFRTLLAGLMTIDSRLGRHFAPKPERGDDPDGER